MATVAAVAVEADTCHVARPGAGSTRGEGGRKAGELREQAEFSFCLNLFNGMTRSRRHYHQLHQLHEQSSATWSIGLATCRLPIGERTSWGRAISHKAITVNCFLQARGGTGHTQIHRHSDRDTQDQLRGRQEEAVHNKWRSRSIGSSSSAWRHATSIFVQRMLQGVRASTTTWDEDEVGDDEAVWMRIGSCICKMLIAPGRPVAAASALPALATATRVRLWRIRHA